MQQTVALRVARKRRLSSTFRNVERHFAACDMPMQRNFVKMSQSEARLLLAGEFKLAAEESCKLRKKIYCERVTPPLQSAIFFQSSQVTQEDLPRVAWPK